MGRRGLIPIQAPRDRSGRSSMKALGRRAVEWYRHPGQELLRGEVAWTWRWLFRGTGRGWLVLYAALVIAADVVWRVAPQRFTGAIVTLPAQGFYLAGGLFFPANVALIAMWVQLIRRRSLAPLGASRLPDLLASRFDSRDLWPALLAAPVIGVLAFALVREVCQQSALGFDGLHRAAFGGEWPLHWFTPETRPLDVLWAIVEKLWALLLVLGSFGLRIPRPLCLTAIAVWIVLPRGDAPRVLGALAIGRIAASLLIEIPVSLLVFVFFRMAVPERYLAPPYFILQAAAEFGLFLLIIRRLRRPSTRARLQRALEMSG